MKLSERWREFIKLHHLTSWNLDICFDRYISIRNYASTGYQQVNTIKGVGVIVGVFAIWLKNYFPSTPYWLSIVLGVILFFGFIIFGFLWDRWKLYDREKEWSNMRNPTLKEIKKNTKEKKPLYRYLP